MWRNIINCETLYLERSAYLKTWITDRNCLSGCFFGGWMFLILRPSLSSVACLWLGVHVVYFGQNLSWQMFFIAKCEISVREKFTSAVIQCNHTSDMFASDQTASLVKLCNCATWSCSLEMRDVMTPVGRSKTVFVPPPSEMRTLGRGRSEATLRACCYWWLWWRLRLM